MLKFCANRVMALQELQASGQMAVGFQRAGCYKCSGRVETCAFFTPLSWVYESEGKVPRGIAAFIETSGKE